MSSPTWHGMRLSCAFSPTALYDRRIRTLASLQSFVFDAVLGPGLPGGYSK